MFAGRVQRLEVDPGSSKNVDLFNIVRDSDLTPKVPLLGSRTVRRDQEERANSEHFVDNPDVPPLM